MKNWSPELCEEWNGTCKAARKAYDEIMAERELEKQELKRKRLKRRKLTNPNRTAGGSTFQQYKWNDEDKNINKEIKKG